MTSKAWGSKGQGHGCFFHLKEVGFFRPNLLHFRKVKDLSLAEQLYLYERTRRFKDPPFDKQQKRAVGVFFSTGKKKREKT